jgi:hypothetical protein
VRFQDVLCLSCLIDSKKKSVLRLHQHSRYTEMRTTATSASAMPAAWLSVVRSFNSSAASRIVEAG